MSSIFSPEDGIDNDNDCSSNAGLVIPFEIMIHGNVDNIVHVLEVTNLFRVEGGGGASLLTFFKVSCLETFIWSQ